LAIFFRLVSLLKYKNEYPILPINFGFRGFCLRKQTREFTKIKQLAVTVIYHEY
jgi:hypothetical protein